MSAPFSIPSDRDFAAALGVVPVRGDREEFVRYLKFKDAGESLTVSFDEIAQSVALKLVRGDVPLLEIFLEGATRMVLKGPSGAPEIHFSFEYDDLVGAVSVRVVHPYLVRVEQLLR